MSRKPNGFNRRDLRGIAKCDREDGENGGDVCSNAFRRSLLFVVTTCCRFFVTKAIAFVTHPCPDPPVPSQGLKSERVLVTALAGND